MVSHEDRAKRQRGSGLFKGGFKFSFRVYECGQISYVNLNQCCKLCLGLVSCGLASVPLL